MNIAIEAKASSPIQSDHLKGLRELKNDYPEIQRRVVISMETASRLTEDGIEILSYQDFIRDLWSGQLTEEKT